MKRFITFALISLSILASVKCQSNLPESTVNLSIGSGQPYGGVFGVKTLLGKNNSGLIVGLGKFPLNVTGFTIGGQLAINAMYFNLNYGTIKSTQLNDEPAEALNAFSFLVGGMFGLGSKKQFFIDAALGHSFGAGTTTLPGMTVSNDTFCFSLGLGYRFVKKSQD